MKNFGAASATSDAAWAEIACPGVLTRGEQDSGVVFQGRLKRSHLQI